MTGLRNPFSTLLRWVGLALARFGLIDAERARQTSDLAWPRIVTGLARMSKTAADVAMVGIAIGPTAIAGVGFAGPYWGMAFSVGAGLAAGTIALVSQRFGAERFDELAQTIRSSFVLVFIVTLPLAALYGLFPRELIALLTSDETIIRYGSDYLRVLSIGVPFAALNLVGSRALIGVDDAYTPMVLRGTGAVANIALNALFIFGFGWGVVGAAAGSVLGNLVVTVAFVVGFSRGSLPFVGDLPLTVSFRGSYIDRGLVRDIVRIGTPVVGRNSIWTVARFPALAFVGLFGPTVVAAYIIARRIMALMTTPSWGFSLAASSLVGRELGRGDEDGADRYTREIIRFSVATHVLAGIVVAAFATDIVAVFVGNRTDPSVPVAASFVYVAAFAVIPKGVGRTVAGALDSTGDTRWPLYSRAIGMFGFMIPLIYLGATTSLGMVGLYLSFFGETLVPAAVNYYRFSTGKWRAISRTYRPDPVPTND